MPALFESTSLMQKADKPPLAAVIADFVKNKSNAAVICKETEKFVLDGVFLLHLIPWVKKTRYQDIALKYANYVISNFRSASVVFDGYSKTPTTKDNTLKRRVGKGISPRTEFQPGMLFQGKKDVFISNTANKQHIINVVSTELKKAGCYVFHSHDDADVDIIKLVVQSSLKCPATVIGEDTDLLVILLYHADVN